MLSGIYPKYPRLDREFFSRDVLAVTPGLIGKSLVRCGPGGLNHYTIIEAEAYRGEEDQASHARFGKTSRNRIMYDRGGLVYVYLIYGMYWMLNIVTGAAEDPQAVLIRGVRQYTGPGRVTKGLGIDGTFNREDLASSGRIWIEDTGFRPALIAGPRVGLDYAGEPWISKPWRFIIKNEKEKI